MLQCLYENEWLVIIIEKSGPQDGKDTFKCNMSFQVDRIYNSFIYIFISVVMCNSLHMKPLILLVV